MGEPGRSQQDTGVEAKQALGDSCQAVGGDVAVKHGLRQCSGSALRQCSDFRYMDVAAKLSLRHNAQALSFECSCPAHEHGAQALSFDTILRLCPWT